MRQTYVNFRELKAAVPIRRVLERYLLLETLKEKGDALSGPCPFCDGETSFRANTGKNCFHCFSCKAGGNMLDLVAAKEDCSVRDAAAKVAEWFGIETSKPDRRARPVSKQSRPKDRVSTDKVPEAPSSDSGKVAEEAPLMPAPPNDSAPPADAPIPVPNPPLTFELKLDPEHPWFAEAGIWPETVKEFGLGFCSKGVMGGRIAFPIRNAKGDLIGYAGRWPGEVPAQGQPLWRYPPGLDLSQVVYPVEKLIDADWSQALLASDPLKVVLCWQLGLGVVICVPSSSTLEGAMLALHRAIA